MRDFTLHTTVAASYDTTLDRVRDHLAKAGFRVLTEIDLQATLRARLGVEVAPQVILGACRPQLADEARVRLITNLTSELEATDAARA